MLTRHQRQSVAERREKNKQTNKQKVESDHQKKIIEEDGKKSKEINN